MKKDSFSKFMSFINSAIYRFVVVIIGLFCGVAVLYEIDSSNHNNNFVKNLFSFFTNRQVDPGDAAWAFLLLVVLLVFVFALIQVIRESVYHSKLKKDENAKPPKFRYSVLWFLISLIIACCV